MLLFVGIPLMYMETCFGQYSATGPITVWKASPLFTGIGWSMILVTFFGSIYYNMLLAWTLMYFWKSITSFSGSLPWTTCSADWNPGNCMLIRTMSDRNRCWRQGGFFAIAHNHSCLLPDGASWLVDESNRQCHRAAAGRALQYGRWTEFVRQCQPAGPLSGTVDKPRSSSDLYF
uniref:Solute carrier family 6 member 8 n=1 Tax=Macrostomum lignano TaxID=282301 RepID=A0A1I8IE01_9PLAT